MHKKMDGAQSMPLKRAVKMRENVFNVLTFLHKSLWFVASVSCLRPNVGPASPDTHTHTSGARAPRT